MTSERPSTGARRQIPPGVLALLLATMAAPRTIHAQTLDGSAMRAAWDALLDEEYDAARSVNPTVSASPLPSCAPTVAPTFVAGFTLPKKSFGLTAELGWPHARVELGYGATRWLEVDIGYRGMYGFSHVPYASTRLLLAGVDRHSAGLSVRAMFGYNIVPRRVNEKLVARVGGGDGVFGEMLLALSLRHQRHGGFLSAGVRLAEMKEDQRCRSIAWRSLCYEQYRRGRSSLAVVVLAEFGWEARLLPRASLFLALGLEQHPMARGEVAPRVRVGLMFEL